jgi:hypothetical protein
MNIYKSFGLLVAAIFLVQTAQAATFTIYNKGGTTIYARPMWGGKSANYDTIAAGQSVKYDSGFQKPYSIRWLENVTPRDRDMSGKSKIHCFKIFEQGINLGVVNLGGKFEILSDGSYSYYFGIDGSGNGVATSVEGL